MDRSTLAGVTIAVVGLVGYVVGVFAPYPFRAFSITGIMAGLTLALVADAETER